MKIHSPNASYSGVSASVQFKDGVGETTDPNLIGWFQDHGYTVDDVLPVCTGFTGRSTPEPAKIEAVTEPISTAGPPIPVNKRKRKDASK